jgi:hypothetical protein
MLLAAPLAFACGFEDPASIMMQRGFLNLSYPESLHVGTAIWQAQLAGELSRDQLAQRDDLSPEARSTLSRVRAYSLLTRFAARLGPPDRDPASLAVVLLGPVMWSWFETVDGVVRPTIHVAAPRAGDVVVVTDTAVLEAVARGDLAPADALDRGLMRLYGEPKQVATVRAWFSMPARG